MFQTVPMTANGADLLGGHHQQRVTSRRAWLLAFAAVTVFAFSVIGTYLPDQEPLSPFDEWVFLDYVDKMTNFSIPQTGELVDQESLEVSSCRGVFVWGPTGSPCGGPYVPSEYPMEGITSADIHPPTYFGATAALAGLVRSVGLSDDLLTSSRMIGAVWLALGLALVVVLARELGAPMLAAVGAAGVLASLPIIRYNNSYITPDALNVAIGALALLGALRVSRQQWPWWSMVAIGALAGAVKTQNALAIGAAACFLLWRAIADRRLASTATSNSNSTSPDADADSRTALAWTYGRAAVGSVVAFVGVQLAWLVSRSVFSVGPLPEQGVTVALSANLLLRETSAFVLRLGLGATEDGLPIPTHAYISTALLLAGCIGAVLYRAFTDDRWGLAACVTLLVFIGSPLLLISQQFAIGDVVPSPARYGASLLAGMIAVTAAAFSTRIRSTALASLGTLLVAVVVIDNLAR
jgi:hypothetical protein